jgi:hypothetical protein
MQSAKSLHDLQAQVAQTQRDRFISEHAEEFDAMVSAERRRAELTGRHRLLSDRLAASEQMLHAVREQVLSAQGADFAGNTLRLYSANSTPLAVSLEKFSGYFLLRQIGDSIIELATAQRDGAARELADFCSANRELVAELTANARALQRRIAAEREQQQEADRKQAVEWRASNPAPNTPTTTG